MIRIRRKSLFCARCEIDGFCKIEWTRNETRKKKMFIVNGFFWRFAERCGVQLISAVVSILLARILTPDDYGKVALVTVFNNIMYVLLDCGIGTALVQKKEVDELDYSSAFFFSIVISFVLYGGMFVAAPYLGCFLQ